MGYKKMISREYMIQHTIDPPKNTKARVSNIVALDKGHTAKVSK